ncbi:MAG: zinc ribbon domain-containing protein [Deltaproteobacteria bacterium]
MFCKNCGNEIPDKAVICVICGVGNDNFEKKKEGELSQGILFAGYVLALVMPFIGGNIGIYAMVKGKLGHGIVMLVLAFFSFLFWIGVVITK